MGHPLAADEWGSHRAAPGPRRYVLFLPYKTQSFVVRPRLRPCPVHVPGIAPAPVPRARCARSTKQTLHMSSSNNNDKNNNYSHIS